MDKELSFRSISTCTLWRLHIFPEADNMWGTSRFYSGPLAFFLIYIKDICNVSSIAKLVLFADNTNLFFSGRDPVHLNE